MERDKDCNYLEEYPEQVEAAELVGITADGLAAYRQGETVFLAELTENGELNMPAEGFGMTHELDLAAYEWTLSDYIEETAKDRGKWRAITQAARQCLDDSVNTNDILNE